jgi:hypothetical protein
MTVDELLETIEKRWPADPVAPSLRVSWEAGRGFHGSIWRDGQLVCVQMGAPTFDDLIASLANQLRQCA